jgi:hypothetical protein
MCLYCSKLSVQHYHKEIQHLTQTIDNFDFFMLLRMEPLLKHMISFGVKSVIDNDIVP